MKHADLPHWSAKAAAWAAEYHDTIRERPVRPDVRPGDIAAMLPDAPPETAAPMEEIFADFARIVPDAMTHWQHPRFFAYFPSNAAPASMLAEQLANAISAQCMLWQTSPAATEIETVMVDWLRQALGLPEGFRGTIQDSASTATLSAVLTMRERALGWEGLKTGLSGAPRLRIYASAETHSSIDKAVRLSGIGQDNLIKIPADGDGAMQVDRLEAAIAEDRAAGHLPAGVVVCTGGTSTGAFDRAEAVITAARTAGLYTHVDAAWAGSAMICPEFRHLWAGVESADSIVFNPHKWLGANFDCSIQFLADPTPQVKTLGLRPAYLETAGHEEIVNYNEWTVPLGRRFRALKLWFLMRAHGLEDLRTRIRNHVAWTEAAAAEIGQWPGFDILTPPRLALFTFALSDNAATEALLEAINADGRIYLTQTMIGDRYAIRMTIGQFDTTEDDVRLALSVIRELADI